MKTIEFNKDNWSGESSTIHINNKTREFTLVHMPGEKFFLELQYVDEADNTEVYHVFLKETNSNLYLGCVERDTKKDQSFASGTVSRDHKGEFSHYIAAAKLICNIL